MSLGVASGALLSLAIHHWHKRLQREVHQLRIRLALAGVIPGAVVGAHSMPQKATLGAALGALCGLLLLTGGLTPFLQRQKEKNAYLFFPLEVISMTLLGMMGVLLGFSLSAIIFRHVPFVQHMSVLKVLADPLLAVFFALLFSLMPGFVFALNQKRPALGSALSFLGGCLVLWVGLTLAPLLYLPGSGLLWSGLVTGLLIIALSILSITYPNMRLLLGVLIIVASVLSFIGSAGGLVLGGLCGILGGSLIISWKGEMDKSVTGESFVNESDNFSV